MTEMTNKMHFQTACNPQKTFTLLWDQNILIEDDKQITFKNFSSTSASNGNLIE